MLHPVRERPVPLLVQVVVPVLVEHVVQELVARLAGHATANTAAVFGILKGVVLLVNRRNEVIRQLEYTLYIAT